MPTLDKPLDRCAFAACPSNRGLASPRVIAHSRLKTKSGWKRRRLCRVCLRTFTATTATVYARLRRSKADFDRAVQMQAEGMTKAAVARVLGVSPSTVYRWLEKAGRHARAFHDAHARMPNPVEFQLDELSCRGTGAARLAWAYSGIEVWSRFWASMKVGNRTLRNTLLFVRELREALGPSWAPVLFTSDEFKYYEPVMRRVFGKSPHVYVQVTNRYWREGILRSDAKLVLGTPAAYHRALERSEDSKRPNTAYVERMNLRKRMCCSMLRRRNPAPGRKPERIEQALEIVRVFYNFVQRHSSLRFGKEKRTPAMQAGIISRPLTIREIFSWVAPADVQRRGRVVRALGTSS